MTLSTPFRKILIANRNEVAVRIIRAARRLGYRTVAVYSTADARAFHVGLADQAVCIGEAEPAASYLNIAAIVDAARRSGADAVHPGYGFLAENDDFAQACVNAGLVFIGPSPQSIRQMGNKGRAKELMLAAGVPCVPGYLGEDQSDARLLAEARRIGFPVMIKASAGGGGRGMRIVQSPDEFPGLLRSAQSEAQSAFGSPELILERAIVEPRHIEIQVVADRHGQVIHLGERDCSVQRRHQKLIEEAPSPAVGPELRARMGQVAVRAARAIGYEGLGTLEFLLDGAGEFYFMEMNTRLQVEHPVTEAVTGLDLVELQLRIAAGQAVGLSQDDVTLRGHAVEVRLCTEDPAQGFLPQSGVMAVWQPAPQLRVEHALASGDGIVPFYDSMFAKVISHGADRAEALRRLASGLEDTVALGVMTNKAFVQRCLLHPDFAAGQATTAFIGKHLKVLLAPDVLERSRARALGAVLLLLRVTGAAGLETPRSAEVLRLRLALDAEEFTATLRPTGGGDYEVEIDGRFHAITGVSSEAGRVRVVCDGLLETLHFTRDGARLMFQYGAVTHELVDTVRAARWRVGEREAADGNLRASTGGRVVSVLVGLGQRVESGQPLLVLEAMKMEHVHGAPVAGTIIAVHVTPGQHVHTGHLLAEIDVEPTASA